MRLSCYSRLHLAARKTICFYLRAFGPLTARGRALLRRLEHGVELDWVPCESPQQQNHPRYHERLRQGRQLIEPTFGPQAVPGLLRGNESQRAHFPIRPSVAANREFVAQTIAEMLAEGSLRAWRKPQPLTVISGLEVAANRRGKLCLVLDARYLNLFDEYVPFQYERLADVPALALPDDWLVLTDFKSGYHQFPMHPKTYRFLGVAFEGAVYYFAVML